MSGYIVMTGLAIILSLLAHGSRKFKPCSIILRIIYCSLSFWMFTMGLVAVFIPSAPPWVPAGNVAGALLSTLILFKPVRRLLSPIFTVINQMVIGRPLLAAMGKLNKDTLRPEIGCGPDPVPGQPGGAANKKIGILESLTAEKIFLASSIPHLNGLWCYVVFLFVCLGEVRPSGFMTPTLVHIPEISPWNEDLIGLLCGLLMTAFGVGLIVTRKFPGEIFRRLGIVKPQLFHIVLALGLAAFTFTYDYVWSLYTHSSHVSAAFPGVLTKFNEGTYLGSGAAPNAFAQALLTGICAGLDEELLFRGALQPVLGIVPAAFLHAAMHQQFIGAPLLMFQIFIWSCIMGIVKRYTNTTTTIIAHATFNFVQVFLIGFNP